MEDQLTDQITKNQSICPLPWKQVHITTTGQVFPCCMWTGIPLGSLRHVPLGYIWTNKVTEELREEFRKNKKPEGCSKCWLAEDTGMRSPRWYACRKYLSRIDNLDKEENQIECWDIRFSNLCNLACRMCGPESSTRWYSDAEVLFGSDWVNTVKKRVNGSRESKRLLDTLLENLEHTSEIYFVGGEPLIMPEHYKVLEAILEQKLSNIYLRYNSNLTTLGPEDKALTLWKKLIEQGNKVEVGASIDGTGKLAEYIRYGCRWEEVEKNLDKMKEAGIPVKIMPTVSVLNVYWMPEFLDWCIQKGYRVFDWDVALPNFVVYPQYYDIRILPKRDKELVCNKCQQYLDQQSSRENWELQKNFIEPIIARLTQQDLALPEEKQEKARKEFCKINKLLDQLRNLKWLELNSQFSL